VAVSSQDGRVNREKRPSADRIDGFGQKEAGQRQGPRAIRRATMAPCPFQCWFRFH
jgi:hypothetical protein